MSAAPTGINRGVRAVQAPNGELTILAAWCGRCKAESTPDEVGRCQWCQSLIVNEDTLSARGLLRPAPDLSTLEDDILADVDEAIVARDFRRQVDGRWGCKIAGCPGRSSQSRGPLAYLCDDLHAAQKLVDRARERGGDTRIRVAGTGLRYAGGTQAFAAADEVERDGRAAAEAARRDNMPAKANQIAHTHQQLAEKIRSAARAAGFAPPDQPTLQDDAAGRAAFLERADILAAEAAQLLDRAAAIRGNLEDLLTQIRLAEAR